MAKLVAAPPLALPPWLRPPSLHLRPHHREALERVHLSMGSVEDMAGPDLQPVLKEFALLIVLFMPSACYLSEGQGIFYQGIFAFSVIGARVTPKRAKYVLASLFK